jgi:hypothetical protein
MTSQRTPHMSRISEASDYYYSEESSSSLESSGSYENGGELTLQADNYYSGLFACISPFKAQSNEELTIKFADRLMILKDNNGGEFVLAKHLSSGKIGYVPRVCITDVQRFISSFKIFFDC